MSGNTRASLLSLTIIAVIVFSAFGPTIAYADGDTPPDPPPAEATSPPTEASTETTSETTEVAPEATATPVESGGTEAEPTSGEAVAQATEEAAPVAEEAAPAIEEPVLTEVPENTSVTVLDENGQSQPLATQEAADAIAESDPIWCPEGAAPVAEQNGCTRSFSSFTELLTALSGNSAYQGPGTIYVEQGAYNGNDPGGIIDFNAPTYDLSNIRNSNLTVTGGWTPGSQTVDPTKTSDFTDTRILIGSNTSRWGGSLTINNITLNYSNPGREIPDPPENALVLYSQGDIALSNVNVTAGPSAGAEIDAGGGVTIEKSNFHRNRTEGATIRAGGNVTISDSSFSNPAITSGRRQKVGLDIDSGGAVTLSNVLANGNQKVGTNIVAGGAVTIGNSFFIGTTLLVGPRNAPTAFLGYGLQVKTPGEINVDSVTANDNFLWGALLDGGGAIAVANSKFNGNSTESDGFIDDTGLFIKGGSIVSLLNVEANNNRKFGTQINATGDVSITDSRFNNNRGEIIEGGVNTFYGHGMEITTLANIFIFNTDANGNSLFGGQLKARGDVSISADEMRTSNFSNTSTGPDGPVVGKGLEVDSGGNTSLYRVVLDNNQTVGADLQAGGFVWLDSVTATNNGSDGVAVQASCTHLGGIGGGTYSGNGGYGLNLGTSALNLLTSPTFSNNGAGNINPANPPTCTFFTASPNPSTGTSAVAPSTAAANVFVSLQVAPPTSTNGAADQNSVSTSDETDVSSANVSLNTFMAGAKTAHGSIFIGKYAYVDSDSGIQVLALLPSTDVIAME